MVVPTSEDNRPNHHTIIVGQTPLDELSNERWACIYDDILSRLPPQTRNDPSKVAFHNPRVPPFRLLQVVREDNLLTTIQEARELEQILWIGRLPRSFGVV